MLSSKDSEDVLALGFDLNAIESQLEMFRCGFPFLELKAPATIGNGIHLIDDARRAELVAKFDRYEGRKVKFVPASGAATRMFKSLYEAKSCFENGDSKEVVFAKLKDVEQVFASIQKFAFYSELKHICLTKGVDLDNPSQDGYAVILSLILSEEGLNYGNLPKGLVKFHSYGAEDRKAAVEHLVEGAEYARSNDGSVSIHFTVSPSHLVAFEKEVAAAKSEVESAYGVTIAVTYSVQKASTDTIAVNLDNTPFRDDAGKLVFRPAGHGALLENLNEIDGDIIFIKNIDNVVPDSIKPVTVEYKKVLAGLLVEVQESIFTVLRALEANADDADALAEGRRLLERVGANVDSFDALSSSAERVALLRHHLNRPIRVCGMVKNQGEPGGGPFFARSSNGDCSLQIVESSQIDLKNSEQKAVFDGSTHFNPVDLVCGVKDYRGSKFDLRLFRDAKTGFISYKSKDGRDLKAMELPGLWNGAMSSWITLFVEVPLLTFNPVKTINDLLRQEHQ